MVFKKGTTQNITLLTAFTVVQKSVTMPEIVFLRF